MEKLVIIEYDEHYSSKTTGKNHKDIIRTICSLCYANDIDYKEVD